jgi:hypothetical protein
LADCKVAGIALVSREIVEHTHRGVHPFVNLEMPDKSGYKRDPHFLGVALAMRPNRSELHTTFKINLIKYGET